MLRKQEPHADVKLVDSRVQRIFPKRVKRERRRQFYTQDRSPSIYPHRTLTGSMSMRQPRGTSTCRRNAGGST